METIPFRVAVPGARYLRGHGLTLGEPRTKSRSSRISAISMGLATLLLFSQGCRNPAPPPLDQDIRASLGTVGVYSIGPTLNTSVSGPIGVREETLKGAAKGGGIGVLSGIGGGALTGAGVGLVCGPFAVICSPIFAVWGAAIGGTGGLVAGGTIGAVNHHAHAIPVDVADGARTAFAGAIAGRDLQADLRREIVSSASGSSGSWIDVGADGGTEPAPNPDYGRFAERGANSVLEVGIVHLVLDGEGGKDPELALAIDARTRLIRVPSNNVLWGDGHLSFESPKVPLSQWTADDSRLLKSEIDRGVQVLAQRIEGEIGRTSEATTDSRP